MDDFKVQLETTETGAVYSFYADGDKVREVLVGHNGDTCALIGAFLPYTIPPDDDENGINHFAGVVFTKEMLDPEHPIEVAGPIIRFFFDNDKFLQQFEDITRKHGPDLLPPPPQDETVAAENPAGLELANPKLIIECFRALGIVPPNTRRVLIDCEAGNPVMLHYETFADSRLHLALVQSIRPVVVQTEGGADASDHT